MGQRTHPALVDTIRRSMRERPTEELLDVWTVNDRATWSAEAFDAVRDVLAERGVVELPPQNDPAPLARRGHPYDDPTAAYWFAWLRPVLWIGATLGALKLARGAFIFLEEGSVQGLAGYLVPTRRMSPALIAGVVTEFGFPASLLSGAMLCLVRRRAGLLLLKCYAWAAVVLEVGRCVWTVFQPNPFGGFWHVNTAYFAADALVLPVVLLQLLRRPEIRGLFDRPSVGFEPSIRGTDKNDQTPARQQVE